MTEVFRDDMNEFAVAVVLRDRIGASPVHAAGDLAAGILEFGVPDDELPDYFGVAEAKQRRAGERAVADPRALVGARSRLKGGPVAIDQDVPKAARDAVFNVASGGREGDRRPIHRGAPFRADPGQCGVHSGQAAPSNPPRRTALE